VAGATTQDEKYMRAALKALGDYTGRRFRLVRSGAAHLITWQPEWDDAVWEGRLPVVLWKLLFSGKAAAPGPAAGDDSAEMRDRRVVDPEQAAPVRLRGSVRGDVVASTGVAAGKRVDLRPVFWAVVFLLFLTERMMVFRNDKA
jgi:hypothetical protein